MKGRVKRSIRFRLSIWAALALVTFSIAAGAQAYSSKTSATSTNAVATVAAPWQVVSKSSVAALTTTAKSAGVLASGSTTGCGQSFGGPNVYSDDPACVGNGNTSVRSSTSLLPAWRWGGSLGALHGSFGYTDLMNQMFSFLGGALFGIASFIWMVILWAGRAALTTDFLTSSGVASRIDLAYADISKVLLNTGPFPLVIAVAVIAAVYAVAVRNNLPRAIGKVVTPAIALGVMLAIGSTTALNPSTLAIRVSNLVNEAASGTVEKIGSIAQGSDASILNNTASGATGGLDCATYENTLYSDYNSVLTGSTVTAPTTTGSTAIASTKTIGKKSIPLLSYLWQRSMLDPWITAQFGTVSWAGAGACHSLEMQAGSDPVEQAAITGAAFGGTPSPLLFEPSGDTKTDQALTFGWIACIRTGSSFSVRPGWDTVGGIDSGWCDNWYNGDVSPDKLKWGDLSSLVSDVNKAGGGIDARNVETTVTAWWGHNNTDRVAAGVTALATSAVYAIGLGGVLVGGLVAQIGLILLLMWLPFILLLIAIGGTGGKKVSGTAGGKLLKMTAGFFGAKVATVLVIGLILEATELILTLMHGVGG